MLGSVYSQFKSQQEIIIENTDRRKIITKSNYLFPNIPEDDGAGAVVPTETGAFKVLNTA